jgi:flavin-dependent dehydrogenase
MSLAASPDHAADVLIIGGGPAGSACAISLRRRGVKRVILVDRSARAPFVVGESAAPNIGAQLVQLGLTENLERLGHIPYAGNISSWGGPEPLVDHFARRGLGHGFHLDRAAFDAWLRASAESAGAHLLSPAELLGVEPLDRGWLVRIRNEGTTVTIAAAVVVDATGRKAALVGRLGVRRKQLDRLVALAMLAQPKPGMFPKGFSLIEPVADGWWYAAELPSGRVILTLMTDADLVHAGNLRDPRMYQQALAGTSHVGAVVELLEERFVVGSFSAASQYAEQAIGPGWLAVGDAQLALDPLTSSGITGALDDAMAAAETIAVWFGSTNGAEAIEAARVYARRPAATLQRYLVERRAWYEQERRWSERSFWKRRRSLGEAV